MSIIDIIPLKDKNQVPVVLRPDKRKTDNRNKESTSNINNIEFLREMLKTIQVPIFIKNEKLEYIGCNKAFATLILGKEPNQIIGKTVFDISPENLARKYDEQDQGLFLAKRG